ncbi:sulfotransferase [Antarctobacter sp.]|uniref:sulfotransferase n=1 Tax=Antarctobacter sp. TaxID=1872577 RepID=UPI002B279838|nr:sulfotransferase [Antarctobacter sp.]
MTRKQVLLVVGAAHSGTTILDAALGVSRQVMGVGEAVRLVSGIRPDRMKNPVADRSCTCGQRAEHCPLWSKVLPDLHADSTVASHFPLVDDAARALSPEVRYVLDSTPDALDHVDGLAGYDVRVLQITRDVRSWVASRRRRRGGSLVSGYVTWMRTVKRIDADLTRRDLPRFRLGYEELALRPREVLTLICEWLHVPFDEAMLMPFGNTNSHIITGNSSIRAPDLAATIRYDGSWLASNDHPAASGLLTSMCAGINRRLVYSNGLLKRRG